MTPARSYPKTPVGPFPTPPRTFEDATGELIRVEALEPADSAEREALVEMYDDFDPADRAQGIPPIGRDDIDEWLDLILPEGLDMVARHENQVVGHTTLVPDGETEHELAIFVHHDYQGRRIGTELLRTLLGAAAEAGIEYVWLTVERWNTVAVTLYERVGFERCDSGSFELEMSLRLAI